MSISEERCDALSCGEGGEVVGKRWESCGSWSVEKVVDGQWKKLWTVGGKSCGSTACDQSCGRVAPYAARELGRGSSHFKRSSTAT